MCIRDSSAEAASEILAGALYDSAPYADQLGPWLSEWQARLRQDGIEDAPRRVAMEAVNPLYVPRNYLLHEVIEQTAPGRTDALDECLDVFRNPYTAQPGRERWAEKRPEWARHKAGCSMLSCSS